MAADHRLGFRPVREEVSRTLPIEGEVPEWLSGTLLRNGPGTWSAGRQSLTHWFDGFAMLRRFRFANGEVAYSNRFLDSEAYAYAREHGELGYREFATDPPAGLLGRLRRLRSPEFTDNACVDVCRVGDRYLAMTESPLVTEIDPDTLETGRRYRFGGFADTITVHSHYDPHERELLGYGTRFGGTSDGGYTLYSVPDGTGDVSILGEVASDPPGYLHSFALTPRYVVLTEPPFVPDRLALLAGSSVIDGYEWRPERGTRFGAHGRRSGGLRGRFGDRRPPAPATGRHEALPADRRVASVRTAPRKRSRWRRGRMGDDLPRPHRAADDRLRAPQYPRVSVRLRRRERRTPPTGVSEPARESRRARTGGRDLERRGDLPR
ncbi:hypothetical protein BRC77_08060 [Halobacteriales archaeon QH_8_64_26]|nr:MAG: hypothetical protein BRC77_08060 [Halobacteriales archaeon QH_8_64_26]